MKRNHLFLAMLLVAASTAPAAAQDWSWRKEVPAGRAVEIRGVNGSIDVAAASGSMVEVVATKKAKRSNPDDVKIVVVEHNDGVTICAVYPTPRDAERPNECRPGNSRNNTRDNDVTVDFKVRLPRNVRFVGRTVNGSIIGRGLTADANVQTVNGKIDLETSGTAEGRTVNGSIHVRMGRADWRSKLEFETVNGGITLELPDEVNTEVEASTVNGSLSSDFPLTVRGRWGPKRMNGTIGSGGRTLELETVNGDIALRRTK